MPAEHSHVYATPWGPVLIEESDGALTRVAIGADAHAALDAPSAATNAFASELLEYLAGKRRVFTTPRNPSGTAFQQAVWHAIEAIPYGQTRTCTDIANTIGHPDSRRQVGRAASACPCPIAVPIHRVASLDDALSTRLRALEGTGS